MFTNKTHVLLKNDKYNHFLNKINKYKHYEKLVNFRNILPAWLGIPNMGYLNLRKIL